MIENKLETILMVVNDLRGIVIGLIKCNLDLVYAGETNKSYLDAATIYTKCDTDSINEHFDTKIKNMSYVYEESKLVRILCFIEYLKDRVEKYLIPMGLAIEFDIILNEIKDFCENIKIKYRKRIYKELEGHKIFSSISNRLKHTNI